MPIKIHNKDYLTVAERVATFKQDYPEYSLQTHLISSGEDFVIMKAEILKDDKVISTGYAEEQRGSSMINKTSALENAETSAVGRALAFFGLAGTEIASADEVNNAIAKQAVIEVVDVAHAIAENAAVVGYIKESLEQDDLKTAADAWFDLHDDVKKSLWVAYSKGGAFTAEERRIMQSTEFRQAHYGE